MDLRGAKAPLFHGAKPPPYLAKERRDRTGHPALKRSSTESKSPLLAKNARNGAPGRVAAGRCPAWTAEGGCPHTIPLLAKNARNGAPLAVPTRACYCPRILPITFPAPNPR